VIQSNETLRKSTNYETHMNRVFNYNCLYRYMTIDRRLIYNIYKHWLQQQLTFNNNAFCSLGVPTISSN